MLSLPLCPFFWDVSCSPGVSSNPWYLRQNTVLPGILRTVPRVVRGGGPCMARRRIRPRTWCYLGVQINLLSQFPILGPIPAPVPAGDWRAGFHRSSVIRTSQRWLQCVRLPTPVLSKGVLPFSLPWLESIERKRLGLPSLAFRTLTEQTAKNVSLGHDSAYHACISWSFPTWPGVMSLARTCTCPRQRLLVWLQWLHRLCNPINLG